MRHRRFVSWFAVLAVVGGTELPTVSAQGTVARKRYSAIQIRQSADFPAVPAVSPEPKFQWGAIRAVNSPGEGRGGVLILTDAAGVKLVAKISSDHPAKGNIADFILARLGIPAAQSLVLDSDNKRLDSGQPLTFSTAINAIQTAVQAKPAADLDHARVQQVFANGMGAGNERRFLLIMKHIPSVSNVGSLAQLVASFSSESLLVAMRQNLPNDQKASAAAKYVHQWRPGSPLQPDRFVPQKSSFLEQHWKSVYGPRAAAAATLMKALGNSSGSQAKFLGRLIVADALLANEDRFKPFMGSDELTLNSGNLILTPTEGLVAIDNLADPADPRMRAVRAFRNQSYDECLSQPPGGPYYLTGSAAPFTRSDWLNGVIDGYPLDTGDSPALTLVLEKDTATTRGVAARITLNMRQQVQALVEDMRRVNPRLAPRQGDSEVDDPKALKSDVNRFDMQASSWSVHLMTNLTIENGRGRAHVSVTKIDWTKFQTDVQAGIDQALKDVTSDQTFQPISAILSPLWKDGLNARRAYWKARLSGKSDAAARQAVLDADRAKEMTYAFELKLPYHRLEDNPESLADPVVFVDP